MSPTRLTQYASGGGCACKIPPGELEEAVKGLVGAPNPNVLVGLDDGDDAAAVRASIADRAEMIVAHSPFSSPRSAASSGETSTNISGWSSARYGSQRLMPPAV